MDRALLHAADSSLTVHSSSSSLHRPALVDWSAAELSPHDFVEPSQRAPQITPFIDRLLREMLEVDATRRPTAQEVERRLDALPTDAADAARLMQVRSSLRELIRAQDRARLVPEPR